MRFMYLLALSLALSCGTKKEKINLSGQHLKPPQEDTISYDQLKRNVQEKRTLLLKESSDLKDSDNVNLIRDYWVNTVLTGFYTKWANTPWDYNGTTEQPGVGSIACGYFVTTLLRDMGVKISRVELAICPSSKMMQALAPGQGLKNLSLLSYADFNKRIATYGKGVYIIGLDYHTGFIINDGVSNWFLHSSYINRQGVVKEPLLNSPALQGSKTRWMISLTSDTGFLSRWLKP
jgi:hypothetical protein